MDFVLPFLFIVCVAGVFSLIFGRRFEEVLPVSLVCSALVLYVFSLFGLLVPGCVCLCLLALAFPAALLFLRGGAGKIRDRMLTGGFLSFSVVYAVVYVLNWNRGFLVWDEVSHWGPMVKEMLRIGDLYSSEASFLVAHKDYPPVFPLFEYFWCFLCGGYREAFLYRALQTLCLSFFIPFAAPCRKSWRLVLLASLAVLFTPGLISFGGAGFYSMILLDAPLALVGSYCAASAMVDERVSAFEIVKYASAFSFLLLAKQMALSLWLLSAVLLLALFVVRNFELFKSARERVGAFASLLLVLTASFLIPLAFNWSWDRHVSLCGIERQFRGAAISAGGLRLVVRGEHPEKFRHVSFSNYLGALRSTPLMETGKRMTAGDLVLPSVLFFAFLFISSGAGRPSTVRDYAALSAAAALSVAVAWLLSSLCLSFYVFLALLILMTTAFFFLQRKWLGSVSSFLYSLFIVGGCCCYAFSLLLVYVFCFGDIEGPRLASYARYMNVYWVFAVSSAAMILFRRFSLDEEKVAARRFAAFLVASLFVFSMFGGITVRIPFAYKSCADEFAADAGRISELSPEGSRIFVVAQDDGFASFSLAYLASPRRFNMSCFNLPPDVGPDRIVEILGEGGYEYLYVKRLDPAFASSWSCLFGNDGPEIGGMYRVERKGGVTRLRRL